ncbi:unnamed protein product, partial [Symbiodinium sp. KB8]
CTPVPRPPKDHEDEDEATETKKPKLRRKKSKKAIPKSPPLTKGAASSHEALSKLHVIQDAGEDAQPPFAPETQLMSTQKDIPETQKEPSPEPKRPRTSKSPGPTDTPKPLPEPSSPKPSSPKSSRRKRKLSSPKPADTPKPSTKKPAATPEPSNRKPPATPKPSSRKPSPKPSSRKPSPKPSSRKPPTSPEKPCSKPDKSPRKSLLTSFEQVSGPSHPDLYVMTLAAPPDTDSDDGRDDMLKLALTKLIEVSSGEENYNPQETDVYYSGSPFKDTKPEPEDTSPEKDSQSSDDDGTAARKTKAQNFDLLSKAEESKLEAVLRKDKYEKKLLWYWCEIGYEGTQARKDEEELVRDTTISDGAPVCDVPFGLGSSLPKLESDAEDDQDDEDDEDDDEDKDGEAAEEAKPKIGKRRSKDTLQQEEPDEDIEGVPDLLDDILRKAEKLQKQIDELIAKHDEIADMKSAYDCEEPIDSTKKLTKLISYVNKLSLGQQTVLAGFKDAADEVSHELAAELAHAIVTEVNQCFGEEAIGTIAYPSTYSPMRAEATLVDFELTGCQKTGVLPSLAFLYGELKDFSEKNGLTWFKGADTVVVLKFLVHKFTTILENADLELGSCRSYLQRILDCLVSSNNFMSGLYRAGLFLEGRRLKRILRHATAMLDGYATCAALAMAQDRARFKYNPKWHFLCHVIHQLHTDSRHHGISLNPLSSSCQMPEDFINKVSTLTRSVQPRRMPLSTIDKYQICVAKVL